MRIGLLRGEDMVTGMRAMRVSTLGEVRGRVRQHMDRHMDRGGSSVARRVWYSAVGGSGERIRGLRCVSAAAPSTGRKENASSSSSSSSKKDMNGEQQTERLSKVLQAAGVSSRRGADSLIEQGRVTVSLGGVGVGGGKTRRLAAADVQPFTRVCIARDSVCVDGEEIDIARSFDRLHDQKVYVALFKPKGYVCSVHSNSHKERMMRMRKSSRSLSSSPSFSANTASMSVAATSSHLMSSAKPVLNLVRPLVEELSMWGAEKGGDAQRLRDVRLFTVGRLDISTTGLLLITNDGQWCNRVMHPSSEIEREYCAVVESRPTRRQLALLAAGTEVEGKHVAPIEVRCDEYVHRSGGGANDHDSEVSTTTTTGTRGKKKNSRTRLYITVGEGRYHEIRELIVAAGLNLRTLKRVRVGGLRLNSLRLREGEYKRLSRDEADMVFL